MKKIRRSMIFIFALCLTLIFGLIGCSATKAPAKKVTPPKKNTTTTNIGFLTDNWPKGCLSCHKNGDKNYSLNAEAKKIEDHPTVNVSDVKGCYNCHSVSRQVLTNWRNRIHKIHVTPQSKFVTKVKGNCVACHKINKDTGVIEVKGLENVTPPPATSTATTPAPRTDTSGTGTTGTGTTGAGTTGRTGTTGTGTTGTGTTSPGTQSGTSTPGTTTPGR